VAEPDYAEPPATAEVGRNSGLGALIPLAIVVVLAGFLFQVARVEIQRRFTDVIGKISTDRQRAIDFGKSNVPDFKIQPIQLQPFQFDPVQSRSFEVRPFPVDGWKGMGMPSGFGNGGSPAPGFRPPFR
jgi:hypothetical protein